MITFNGGPTYTARIGAIRLAQRAASRARRNIRSYTLPTKMLRPMPNGLANVCRRRRSGNSQRAAGLRANRLSGARSFDHKESGWRIRFKACFRSMTREKTNTSGLAPLPNFRPTGTAFMTWRETYGNGRATGIDRIITSCKQVPVVWHEIRKVQTRRMIPLNRMNERKLSEVGRFFAP